MRRGGCGGGGGLWSSPRMPCLVPCKRQRGGGGWGREVLEWPYTVGGAPPPPRTPPPRPLWEVTELAVGIILPGHFWCTNLWVPDPPPPARPPTVRWAVVAGQHPRPGGVPHAIREPPALGTGVQRRRCSHPNPPGGRPGPVLVCDTPQPPPPPPRVLKDSGAGAMAPTAPNFLSHAELRGVLRL